MEQAQARHSGAGRYPGNTSKYVKSGNKYLGTAKTAPGNQSPGAAYSLVSFVIVLTWIIACCHGFGAGWVMQLRAWRARLRKCKQHSIEVYR
jgi:hypothetical protein